jgi:nicotinamidase-related amidase
VVRARAYGATASTAFPDGHGPEPAHHRDASGRPAGITALDRTTVNAWEDAGFKQAVQAAGRRKLIMAALWTEACLTFPSLDAMREGYRAYPVTDAVGGTSPEAHQAGLDRIALAGGKPTSVVQVGCELQRDWAHQETAEGFTQILFGGDRPLAGASSEPAGNGVRAGR